MRLLVRALVVASAIAVAAWGYLRITRPSSPAPRPPAPARRDRPAVGPIDAAALPGSYQGPIQHADGKEEWLVLEVTRVVTAPDDEVAFDYTLSSVHDTVRDHGRASLRDRWIRFGGFSGEIRTRPDGAISFRSAPIDGPPSWMLEGVRPASKTAGGTRP